VLSLYEEWGTKDSLFILQDFYNVILSFLVMLRTSELLEHWLGGIGIFSIYFQSLTDYVSSI